MSVRVINADCLTALPELAAEGFRAHAVVTDPPYGIGFMGRSWDAPDNVAFRPTTWAAIAECMLPGAHLAAFGGMRTWHRMAVAIEDAGFEIRDTLCWLYGSGFPKSHDVSKGIDKAAGAERTEVVGSKLGRPGMARDGSNQRSGFDNAFGGNASGSLATDITAPATPEAAAWSGWGTALKPAFEPIILARKPLDGTVAANTLKHGCGGLNIDACRVGTDVISTHSRGANGAFPKRPGETSAEESGRTADQRSGLNHSERTGRWPANVLHDGSPEVEEAFARFGERTTNGRNEWRGTGSKFGDVYGGALGNSSAAQPTDTGSASRFFYSCKADASDRAGSRHPTVKPTALMRWLVQLVCPPGGTVLDPFAGTGSTGLAADQLGMNAVLIERDPTYAADARRKITSDAPLFTEVA